MGTELGREPSESELIKSKKTEKVEIKPKAKAKELKINIGGKKKK